MSDLDVTTLTYEEARDLDINACDYDITLKRDGTLIYYKDGKLFSPRCERSERFKHILEILNAYNFPNCMGEMFIDEKGSNVFDVSRKENWKKAKFMPFDLIDNKMTFKERKALLNSLIIEVGSEFITETINFPNFNEGWKFVLDNDVEGLVIRNEDKWYKVKLLKEAKIEIVEHEVGKDKGTFILKNGSRISGTSTQFVIQYTGIKNRGKKAIAEFEYAFLTKGDRYFQPRLRQIVEVEK